ncbi:MAG: hypothetical protein K0R17_333 [Rariglobus sp.]|jgi:creatinine amidohydrolase|nr:hypothetical protein [Rariglobus sp.]
MLAFNLLTQRVLPARPTPALCICDDATFLPWRSWTQVAAIPRRDRVVVIVPVAGMADHGEELPLDIEEQVLMSVVREASLRRDAGEELLVVPPLRFVTGAVTPDGGTVFTVDAPVAHAFIDEVCGSLAASGFRKVVLCNASPWNEELCDAAARDIRIARGIQMFCVNLSALGVGLAEGGDGVRVGAAGGRLAALLAEIARRPALASGGVLSTKP